MRALYRGCGPLRLWRKGGRALALGLALSAALGSGGCSLSYQLDSMFGDAGDRTGSIAKPADAAPEANGPRAADLVYAKAAASEVLRRGGKDASLPWENPTTGARGTVTPIKTAYVSEGRTCRDFLASYVSGKSETWMQGEACREARGAWEIRSLKPWKNS